MLHLRQLAVNVYWRTIWATEPNGVHLHVNQADGRLPVVVFTRRFNCTSGQKSLCDIADEFYGASFGPRRNNIYMQMRAGNLIEKEK